MCSWSSWFVKTIVLFTPITIVMLIGSKEILFARTSIPAGIITWTSLELRRTEDVDWVTLVVDPDVEDSEEVDDEDDDEDVEMGLVVSEELVVLEG